jgi:hypothetical protein
VRGARNEAAAMTGGPSTDRTNLYCWVSSIVCSHTHRLILAPQHEQTNYYHPGEDAFSFRRRSLGYFPDENMGPGIVGAWKDAGHSYPTFPNLRFHDI